MSDSEEDDEDDEDRLREELKDLIDDAPIDEEGSDGDDSDGSGNVKRKKSDDEDELDDRLEDDDYDLIEENLGVKVQRTVSNNCIDLQNHFYKFHFSFLETVQTIETHAN